MAGEKCDSKTFTITLIVPEVKIRVEIIDAPTQLEEGEPINVIARVHNDSDKEIDITKVEFLEGSTSIWKFEPVADDNVQAKSYRDFELWTFLRAPNMPDHSVTLRVEVCARFAYW